MFRNCIFSCVFLLNFSISSSGKKDTFSWVNISYKPKSELESCNITYETTLQTFTAQDLVTHIIYTRTLYIILTYLRLLCVLSGKWFVEVWAATTFRCMIMMKMCEMYTKYYKIMKTGTGVRKRRNMCCVVVQLYTVDGCLLLTKPENYIFIRNVRSLGIYKYV